MKIIELFLFLVLGVIALLAFFNHSRPKIAVLSLLIFTTAWQGGLWLSFLRIDLRFPYILIILLFFYIISFPTKKFETDRFQKWILIPTIGLIISALVAYSRAEKPDYALGGVFTLVLNFMLFVNVVNTIEKPKDVDTILKALFVALLFQCLLALLQYKFRHFKLGIIDQRQSGQWWRTKGTFFHANAFGMYLLFILPFLFRYIVIMAKSQNIKKYYKYILLFALGLLAFYTTQNRGSWVGFAAGMGITLLIDFIRIKGKFKKVLMRVVGVTLLLAIVFSLKYGQRIYDRFFGGHHNIYKQEEGRKRLVEESIPIIKENFPYGIGMNNYLSKLYRSREFVHNIYLLVTAELGFGIFFFMWIVFAFIFKAIKTMKVPIFYVSNLGSAFLAMLIGFLISSWVGPDWLKSDPVRMHFYILGGIIFGESRMRKRLTKLIKLKKLREMSMKRAPIPEEKEQLITQRI